MSLEKELDLLLAVTRAGDCALAVAPTTGSIGPGGTAGLVIALDDASVIPGKIVPDGVITPTVDVPPVGAGSSVPPITTGTVPRFMSRTSCRVSSKSDSPAAIPSVRTGIGVVTRLRTGDSLVSRRPGELLGTLTGTRVLELSRGRESLWPLEGVDPYL